MKRLVLTGILTVAVAAMAQAQPPAGQAGSGQGTQTPPAGQQAGEKAGQQGEKAGQATAAKVAAGTRLGTVRIPRRVLANGEALPAGSYQLRVTDETAKPASGQTPEAERWVEFLQGGKVRGRELASVVPDSEIAQVAEGTARPARGGHRVDLLKAQKYWRVWVNKGGNNYLIHLPPAEKAKTGK